MKVVDKIIFFIENRMVLGMNNDELFAKNVPYSNKLLPYGYVFIETAKTDESFQIQYKKQPPSYYKMMAAAIIIG